MIQSIKGRKTRKRKRGGWRERERENDWGGTKQVQKKLSFLSLLSCPYTQEILYVQEKMGESVLVRWMNLEPVIQSEVSQKEKNQILHSNTYIWNLEKWY